MAINFLTTTNTLPEIQINDTGNNPRLELQESGIVSGGISTTGGALVFEASSGIERARISSTGLFGIGKTPNQWILDVDSANAYIGSFDGSGNTGVVLNSNNSTAAQIIGYSNSVSAYNDLDIRSNATAGSGIYIDGSTSRVGIGTTAPSMALHVKGGDEATMKLESTTGEPAIFWAPGGSNLKWENRASASRWQLYQYDNSEWVFNIYDAKVGIGTISPTEKLQVNGDILINNSTISTLKSGGSLYIDLNTFGSYSGRNFRISDNGTSLVNVKQTGEFGIGTTSPTYKLDVNGNTARIGSSSQQTTTFYLTATDTSGSPAVATEVIMQGYEGRGIGTFYQDVTYSGEEWYAGMPYGGAFNYYQIGYDYSGSQAEYAANSLFRVYHNGKTILSTYGSGTHTGTAAKYLAVTSSGEIIETGSGGVLPGGPYLPLAGGTMTGTGGVIFPDNFNLKLGAGQDLELFHNGTQSYIQNSTGDLTIINYADDKDIIFKSDDGSGGVETYFYIDGSGNRNVSNKNLRLLDSRNLSLGSSDDLRIYHNGTNSNIENFTGELQIIQNLDDGDIKFLCDDGSGGTAQYFRLDGGSVQTQFLKSTLHYDNVKANFGDGSDLKIYHDGSNSNIVNETGDLLIEQKANDGDIKFYSDDGSGNVAQYLRLDGGIASLVASKDLLMALDGNGGKIKFGASQDLQMYHDGSNSYIQNATGDLYIQGNGDDVVIQGADDVQIKVQGGEVAANFAGNGGVDLYYDNSKKFETTNTGVTVSGTRSIFAADTVVNSFSGTAAVEVYANASDSVLMVHQDDGNHESVLHFRTGGNDTKIIVPPSTNALQIDTETTTDAFVLSLSGYLTLQDGIAATNTSFSGTMNIAGGIYHIGDTNTYFGFNTADSIQLVTGGGQRLLVNNNGIKIGGGATVTTILDEDNMASDSATALATQQSIKAYVDTSITGSTTYRGTWDPNVSLNSGYGNPNLNTVTKQDGYYYICSGNGVATPNGSGTEPDSWHTGDWVVYNSDLGSSGEWQKIDNTSVISGTGTGQKVVKWDGSGTSETLANGPITFSSNDSTFAGTVSAEDNIYLTDAGTIRAKLLLNASDRDNVELRAESLGSTMKFFTVGTEVLELDASQNATFAGDLQATGLYVGSTNTSYDFYNNGSSYFNGSVIVNSTLTVDSSGGIVVSYGGGGNPIGIDIHNTGSATGDDAKITFETQGQYDYIIGIDRSAAKFKISRSDTFGTNDVISLDSSGNTTFAGSITASSSSTAQLQVSGWSDSNGANNANGSIYLGNTAAYRGVIDYDAASSGSLIISNTWDNDAGNIIFKTKTAGTDVVPLTLKGSGNAIFVGNVGIGTANPENKLHLLTSTSDTTQQLLIQNGSSGDAAIKFNISGDTYSFGIDNSDSDKFKLSAGNLGTNDRITVDSSGLVGIGTASPTYKLSVSGGIEAGGKVTYSDSFSSLTTTGSAVAGLTAGFNGASAGFEFKCYGGVGKYQRIVYSCYCSGSTWYTKKVIDEGTNDLDVSASADGATITFTYKATSATQSYSPRVLVEATGHSINSTYA